MAKTTAWLVTVLGVLALPPVKSWFNGFSEGFGAGVDFWAWLVAIFILIIGITKLTKNYSKRKR